MKALSIRAPWTWAILHGKPVENRDWNTNQRGRILIHQSKWWRPEEIAGDWDCIRGMAFSDCIQIPEPDWKALKALCGCIIGSVEIVDCVTEHSSRFFVGQYGFVLRKPIELLKPIPCKGQLGFFDTPFFNDLEHSMAQSAERCRTSKH